VTVDVTEPALLVAVRV
jgi:hypothetical protein